MRLAVLIAVIVVAFGVGSIGRGEAKPPPMRVTADHGAVLIARCPSGYRKSTITARCVRSGTRFPTLSWF